MFIKKRCDTSGINNRHITQFLAFYTKISPIMLTTYPNFSKMAMDMDEVPTHPNLEIDLILYIVQSLLHKIIFIMFLTKEKRLQSMHRFTTCCVCMFQFMLSWRIIAIEKHDSSWVILVYLVVISDI